MNEMLAPGIADRTAVEHLVDVSALRNRIEELASQHMIVTADFSLRLGELTAAVEREAARVRELEKQLGAEVKASAAWRKQAQALAKNHEKLEQRFETLVAEQAALRVREAQLERDVSLAAIAEMRKTLSWRLTAPFRVAGRALRGDWASVGRAGALFFQGVRGRLPQALQRVVDGMARQAALLTRPPDSSRANFPAVAELVDRRNAATATGFPPVLAAKATGTAPIDISVVTHNDERWLAGFVRSLLAVDYRKDLLHVIFMDHASTDGTPAAVARHAEALRIAGLRVTVASQPNKGFGAGHNAAMRLGEAPFVLVTNVDLELAPDCLSRVVAVALADAPGTAAWELRQAPHEHPKYYDPVTGLTNWNAHACVLLRRSAVMAVGGYDEKLFMYGEDVELSYRLRGAGHDLRYVPAAWVRHHNEVVPGTIRKLQFSGSTLANLYLRLKFGGWRDALVAPFMALGLALSPGLPNELRGAAFGNIWRFMLLAPQALASRRQREAHFPFRGWDYELTREGAERRAPPLDRSLPLVTVVTRSTGARPHLLRQALASVANQTYPNIEHIVVEDGGDSLAALLAEAPTRPGHQLRFIALPKCGRSAAGNAGLAAARGRWCLFLDDDDLLFADHVETLARALLPGRHAAAYALCWEVPTMPDENGACGYVEMSHRVPNVLRQDFDGALLQQYNYLPIQAVLFERRLFEERGGLEEDMSALEDWVFWNKLALGNRFSFVNRVTSLYRVPGNGTAASARHEILANAYATARARIELNASRIARAAKGRARGKVSSPAPGR